MAKWTDDLYYELFDEACELAYEAGTKTLNSAKNLCPVETGYLRRGIMMDVDQTGETYSVTINCTAHYGLFVEFGTIFMFAQPFLFNSFTNQMNQFEIMLKQLSNK